MLQTHCTSASRNCTILPIKNLVIGLLVFVSSAAYGDTDYHGGTEGQTTFCRGELAYDDGLLCQRNSAKDGLCTLQDISDQATSGICDDKPKSAFRDVPLWIYHAYHGGGSTRSYRYNCGFYSDAISQVACSQ